MHTPSIRAACLAAILLTGRPAIAQDAAPADDGSSIPVAQGGDSHPYLSGAAVPDMSLVLAPPPASGSAAEAADRAAFLATRALEGTPRWTLATHDADAKPKALLADFGCALGADLGQAEMPRLRQLLGRVLGDVEVAFRTAKANIKRLRPLVGNDLPICVARTDRLTGTYSYPSGHATRGWTFALVLAELAPDRASAILARGRVYGESRVVCGAHWPSDVEAGRTVGAALVAALHGDATFRADLDASRAEVAAARTRPVGPDETATCHVEAEAAATRLP